MADVHPVQRTMADDTSQRWLRLQVLSVYALPICPVHGLGECSKAAETVA